MHRLVRPTATYITILGAEGLARGLMFAALASYWVVQAGLSPVQLVLLGTSLEATLFLLQVPTGAFADVVGRRPATVIGYGLLSIGLGLQALSRDFGALLILQAISGVGWAFLIGSMEAWIADRAGTDSLERVFLRGGQAEHAGLIGGLVMTVFIAQVDVRLSILAGGALLVAVSAGAAVLMTEPRIAPASVARPRWRELTSTAAIGVRRIRASTVLWLLVLVTLALGISSEGWDRLYAAHLMRDLGLESAGRLSPAGWLAAIGVAQAVLGIVAFQVAARRLDASGSGNVLVALYLVQAALMLGFAIVNFLPVALAALLGAATARRLGLPLVDAWIARETPSEVRATVLSVVGQADSLGQIAGGPVVGLVGNVLSVPIALALSGVLLVPAAVFAAVAARASKRLMTEQSTV